MDTRQALEIAGEHLKTLKGSPIDVLTVRQLHSVDAAINLAKVVSKLSPILGNMLEFTTVEFLNQHHAFKGRDGTWRRQDPGFPDAILDGPIEPQPGFEIKAWFPLATEITGRFKDSQNHFVQDQTDVLMIAWLPSELLWGVPQVIDLCIVSGRSVAEARDTHYHQPPSYLVLEPQDTGNRTRNLQQTNTNGFKFQGNRTQLADAQEMVRGWGPSGTAYKTSPDYQLKLRELQAAFTYRGDTNFAKMDRIEHQGIEDFKVRVLNTVHCGLQIGEWAKMLIHANREMKKREEDGVSGSGPKEAALRLAFQTHLGLTE
jgi:hypothetical protein